MKRNRPTIAKVCEQCGKQFAVRADKSQAVKYCSLQCVGIAHRRIVVIACAECGTTIERRPSDIKVGRVYCSKECGRRGMSKSVSAALKGNEAVRLIGKRNIVFLKAYYEAGHKPWNYRTAGKNQVCKQCGCLFDVHPHKLREKKGKFCSIACYRISTASPDRKESDRLRGSPEMREWRRKVYKRDGFVCQRCKVPGKKITAHHIEPFAENAIRRFDVSNGITLCWPCHMLEHQKTAAQNFCVDCGKEIQPRGKRCRLCHNRYAAQFRRKDRVPCS